MYVVSVASLEPHLPVAQPHPPGPQEAADPLERALADLHDDLGELLFLCDAAATRLSRLEVELADACPVRATRDLLGRAATSARRRYRALKGQIHTVRGQARYAPRSAALLGRIAGERVSLADRLRAEQALVAGIVARSDDARSLDDYREHLGANIPDVAVHSLAPPDRGMLERRLERLQRNASHLAERLARSAPPDMAIAYPGIGAHHLAGAGGGPRFRGGCISVAPRGRTPHPEYQRRIVTNALSEAARRGVRLYAGSSFGFDTTRIYLAAARAEHGSPFVRIAAGTEHWLELDALSDVLAAAIGVSAGPGSM